MTRTPRCTVFYFLVYFLVGAIFTGCATTVSETTPTTISTASGALVKDATAGTRQLLDEMLQVMSELSEAMQYGDRTRASERLERITLLAEAIQRSGSFEMSDQLAADFRRVVNLAKSSVERNRPADADKALRFLPLIIDALPSG